MSVLGSIQNDLIVLSVVGGLVLFYYSKVKQQSVKETLGEIKNSITGGEDG